MPLKSPIAMCRSLWQTPEAEILTTTCPGPGDGSSSSSRTIGLRGPCILAALKLVEQVLMGPKLGLRRHSLSVVV